MPLSFLLAKTYLTTNRLLFLIMHQQYSQAIGGDDEPEISGVTGTWFEIPLSSISEYDIRPFNPKKYAKEDLEKITECLQGRINNQSLLEIIYDEKDATGRYKDNIEGLMQRGKFSKLLGKVERISDKIFIVGPDATTIAPSLKQYIGKGSGTDNKTEAIFCSKCGTKQKGSDSRFCSKCGNSLQPPIEESH